MKAATLFKKDDAKRKKSKIPACSFISPEFPKPKTVAEKAAMAIIKKECPNGFRIHIYNVAELLEQAYNQGVKDRKKK